MNATISLDSLLTPLLSLSKSNKKWIADHLYENIRQEEAATDFMTKEELLADLKEAMREVRDIQAGKIKAKTMKELLSEL